MYRSQNQTQSPRVVSTVIVDVHFDLSVGTCVPPQGDCKTTTEQSEQKHGTICGW